MGTVVARCIAVLGSTGSVGCQTLAVVRSNPTLFKVESLAAGSNLRLLREQISEFKPRVVSVKDAGLAAELKAVIEPGIEVLYGREGAEKTATLASVDIVVAAIIGFEGLFPVLAAIRAGKAIALANKESLVAAGPLVMSELARSASRLIPVDSEHSSIYQCLRRRGIDEKPRRIAITASGGPFLKSDLKTFANIRPSDAVKHPTWSMGAKISVDSATMMNKGLEVIEAAMLFDIPGEQIEVLVHPQSVIHGLVEYSDGTMLAALFEPDMRTPISYALKELSGFHASVQTSVSSLDLLKRGELQFLAPDAERFPALGLCYQALALGGSAPAVLNAVNEVAVEMFLSERIGFLDISHVVSEALRVIQPQKADTLAEVIAADARGRSFASDYFAESERQKSIIVTASAKSPANAAPRA